MSKKKSEPLDTVLSGNDISETAGSELSAGVHELSGLKIPSGWSARRAKAFRKICQSILRQIGIEDEEKTRQVFNFFAPVARFGAARLEVNFPGEHVDRKFDEYTVKLFLDGGFRGLGW